MKQDLKWDGIPTLYYSNLTSCKHFVEGDLPDGMGALVSYALHTSYIKNNGRPFWAHKYFLDSGAFTADSQGKPIDIHTYIDYIHSVYEQFDVIAALDVIGSWEGSKANWAIHREKMKPEALIKTIPVFHESEPFDLLHHYADTCSYIGLGGVASFKNKKKLATWLDRVFSDFPDPQKVGFHGFGIMDLDLLKRYPWRSVDGSTAHVYARYGAIQVPWSTSGVQINPSGSVHAFKSKPVAEQALREYVESLGFNYELAKEANQAGIHERAKITIAYIQSVVKDIPSYFHHRKIYHV